jgi:hypothetical protein
VPVGNPVVGTGPDTGLGGRKDYAPVGPARLTSISPTRVSTAGGVRVTITGEAIPVGARVRIGTTTGVTVSAASATSLSFTTPALVLGTYDVYVFAPDGSSSVLSGGLTYLTATGSSTPTTPGQQPGSQPATGSQPAAGGGTGGSTDGSVAGPHGERLMHSARFAALGKTIWTVNCSSACSGLPV